MFKHLIFRLREHLLSFLRVQHAEALTLLKHSRVAQIDEVIRCVENLDDQACKYVIKASTLHRCEFMFKRELTNNELEATFFDVLLICIQVKVSFPSSGRMIRTVTHFLFAKIEMKLVR